MWDIVEYWLWTLFCTKILYMTSRRLILSEKQQEKNKEQQQQQKNPPTLFAVLSFPRASKEKCMKNTKIINFCWVREGVLSWLPQSACARIVSISTRFRWPRASVSLERSVSRIQLGPSPSGARTSLLRERGRLAVWILFQHLTSLRIDRSLVRNLLLFFYHYFKAFFLSVFLFFKDFIRYGALVFIHYAISLYGDAEGGLATKAPIGKRGFIAHVHRATMKKMCHKQPRLTVLIKQIYL